MTVNVQDVPWNVALDAVLKANRLGIEVNGNILRVATTDVLAKEAETQKVINDSRLDASPLVTEFIRLNYARASGTLAQAAGSTGAFSGGSTNLSFSGGAGGDATGGGGDQGLLPIISRRLSRRGSIEVDGRSNTLIITDVKENIDAIRQLVAILDQPEPQVEIETRIVIAQRNFSRDLGAQLSGWRSLTCAADWRTFDSSDCNNSGSGGGGGGGGSGSGQSGSGSNGHAIWSNSAGCVRWLNRYSRTDEFTGCRSSEHRDRFDDWIVWHCSDQCAALDGRIARPGEDSGHSTRYGFEQPSSADRKWFADTSANNAGRKRYCRRNNDLRLRAAASFNHAADHRRRYGCIASDD